MNTEGRAGEGGAEHGLLRDAIDERAPRRQSANSAKLLTTWNSAEWLKTCNDKSSEARETKKGVTMSV